MYSNGERGEAFHFSRFFDRSAIATFDERRERRSGYRLTIHQPSPERDPVTSTCMPNPRET